MGRLAQTLGVTDQLVRALIGQKSIDATTTENDMAAPEKPPRTPITLKTAFKYWLLFMLVLAVLGMIFGDRRPSESSGQEASQTSAALVGECSKHPVEIFPVRERMEGDRLSRLTDSSCPNARFHPDERIEVRFRGQTLFIQTRKVTFTGPAFYEIVSIKGS